MVETNIMQADEKEAYMMTGEWKSPNFRLKVVKRITDALCELPPSPEISLSEIVKSAEIFEEKVNDSAKTEAEYIATVEEKIETIYSMPHIELKYLLPNLFESGKNSNKHWQRQVYQKVLNLKEKHLVELHILYLNINSKIQEHESSPQESKRIDLEKYNRNKKMLDSIFQLFNVNRNQITVDFKKRLEQAEKYIQLLQKNSASSHRKHNFTKQISQQNNMCVQEQQLATQNNDSELDIDELLSFMGSDSDTDNVAQQQTPYPLSTEEFGVNINTMGISASSLIEDCNDLNEVSHKSTHVSVENHHILQEIEEMNNLLIDIEVVICDKDDTERTARVATEQSEEMVIKYVFNAMTINEDLVSHFTADKKSLIKPLWLLVPKSYPFSSPVILDNMQLEVSEGLQDLSVKVKEKLRLYLQSIDEPWSLKVIARSWEGFAREEIMEYAQAHGGEAFSSKYGTGCDAFRF